MAEEEQLAEETERAYMISPITYRKIQKLLLENPGRYNDTRELVSRALDYFLAYEMDPWAAEKKVQEDFVPTIPQLAFAKEKGEQLVDYTNSLWPGIFERNEKKIEQYLIEHPRPTTQKLSVDDQQAEARASTNYLEKLRERKNDVLKFIEKIDFNKVQPKDNQEEIFYDGWPLISTYYSRILPAKISIMAIADLMHENQSEMIRLDENNTEKIYGIAEALSDELKTIEEKQQIKRAEKYSTGLPKPFKGDMNASQALSKKRWKDRFIGKRRKYKDTDKNGKSIEYFDGLLITLGLVRAFYAEDKKKVFLTLTTKGKEFYSLDNRMIGVPLNYDEEVQLVGSFDPKERKFLVTKILPERKLEMELIKTAIKEVNKLTNGTGAIIESLDAKFMDAIKTFAESEKNLNVQKKILDEIINNTKKAENEKVTTQKQKLKLEQELDKEKDTMLRHDIRMRINNLNAEGVLTPIQSHRVATMGRLAEMGLVKWIIGEDSKSTYKINEEAREQVDVILNTK